jgi:serine/threonine protein kinase
MPHAAPLQADDPMRVGRYRLTARIEGMPSSGSVYLARDMNGGEVTVSLLDGDWTAEAAERDRFSEEASAARRVAPYCAARILASGFDAGHAYLVSEYFNGPSLQELIAAKGPWQGRELTALAIGTATGLAAIHEAGLVHGGFGPEYLVLGPEGPRVIEFGISPPYGSATPSADMRGWAQTVLYAAAGGPASAEDLALLPEPLRALTAQCLSPEPGDRLPAWSVVTGLLGTPIPPAGVLAEGSRRGAAAVARRPAPSPRAPAVPPKPRSRRKITIWAAVVTIAVVAIAVGVRLALSAGSTQSGQATASPDRIATTHRPGQTSRPPAPSATVPAALAGTWSGQVSQSGQSGPDTFTVKVVLAAGATGGSVSYSGTSVSCSGKLSAVSGSPGSLKLSQAITQGPCLGGMVTLTAGPAGTVGFSFHGKSGPSATGTLSNSTAGRSTSAQLTEPEPVD